MGLLSEDTVGIKKLTFHDLKKMERELIIILRSEIASVPSLRELYYFSMRV
jgi:hypothetical protein